MIPDELNRAAFASLRGEKHYQAAGIECIDVMEKIFGEEAVEHFCLLNAFKYLWRCNEKGSYRRDIEKAADYLNYIVKKGEVDLGEEQQ